MQKIITICLLVLLAYCQLGHSFVMQLAQRQHKLDMKQKALSRLEDADLFQVDLAANAATVHWEEDNREFSINGEMFDVVRIKWRQGKRIAFCINDKKEEQLVRDYKLDTKRNTDDPKKAKSQNQSITLFCTQGYDIINYEEPVVTCYNAELPVRLLIVTLPKTAPPPKSC